MKNVWPSAEATAVVHPSNPLRLITGEGPPPIDSRPCTIKHSAYTQLCVFSQCRIWGEVGRGVQWFGVGDHAIIPGRSVRLKRDTLSLSLCLSVCLFLVVRVFTDEVVVVALQGI